MFRLTGFLGCHPMKSGECPDLPNRSADVRGRVAQRLGLDQNAKQMNRMRSGGRLKCKSGHLQGIYRSGARARFDSALGSARRRNGKAMKEKSVEPSPQPGRRFSRLAMVLAGIVAGQFLLYGPSLTGRKVLLPLNFLAADALLPAENDSDNGFLSGSRSTGPRAAVRA